LLKIKKHILNVKSDALEIDVDDQRNIITEIHNDDMRETLQYFMDAYIEYCYDNLNYIFNNPTDIHVADSIFIFLKLEKILKISIKKLFIFL
jgi:hypothetical protein